MIFEVAQDLHDAVASMPSGHPKRRMLELLEEAVRRDIHFIARHPTTLFQCLWNTCWWYDCPEAANFYEEPQGGWPTGEESPPWSQPGRKLCQIIDDSWRQEKQVSTPQFLWFRSRRPPKEHLGGALRAVLASDGDGPVTYSLDGQRVLCGSAEVLQMWDAATGQVLRALPHSCGDVLSLAFSPDGTQFATGTRDCKLRVWDAACGIQRCCGQDPEGPVWAVAFLPDGNRIVSASDDGTIVVWDAATGRPSLRRKGHQGPAFCIAVATKGPYAVSGGVDKDVCLWHTEDWTVVRRLNGHTRMVRSVGLSSDGRRIVSGSDDRAVGVWDAESGTAKHFMRGHGGTVLSVAISRDGSRIASGSEDETARIWDAANGTEIGAIVHASWVHSVAFSPDGKQLLTMALDNRVRVWDARSSAKPRRLAGDDRGVGRLAISADGIRVVAEAGTENMLRKWDVQTGNELAFLKRRGSVAVRLENPAFSPDGTLVAAVAGEQVALWEAEAGIERSSMRGHLDLVECIAFSPDGEHIATGSRDKTVRVWDCTSGREIGRLDVHNCGVDCIAFSPDGDWIATGSRDKRIVLWPWKWDADTSFGTPHFNLFGHEDGVTSVAFSGSGAAVASGCWDKVVRVWDVADVWDPSSKSPVRSFHGHTGTITRVAFSTDGTRVVSGSVWDGTVRIWDLATSECEIFDGVGDISTIAAGVAGKRPWRALARRHELVLEEPATGLPVAWLPASLTQLLAGPTARTWAGVGQRDLYLFTLEGAGTK